MFMNFLKICNILGRYFLTSWLLFEKSERFLKKTTRITCALHVDTITSNQKFNILHNKYTEVFSGISFPNCEAKKRKT